MDLVTEIQNVPGTFRQTADVAEGKYIFYLDVPKAEEHAKIPNKLKGSIGDSIRQKLGGIGPGTVALATVQVVKRSGRDKYQIIDFKLPRG